MTPGQQFEELWKRFHRASSPWNWMLAKRRLNRAEVLAVIADVRAVLDQMEQLVKRS